MIANVHKYDSIEYTNEDDILVGRILMDGQKFMYAEIVDDCITDSTELTDVQKFLNEVETFMDAEA